jgi:hypothetical protein
MCALEDIMLREWGEYEKSVQQSTWLPASSAARVHSLDASFTTLSSVPSGMQALEWLVVQDCGWLIDDWLPASSRACIYYLDAKASRVRRVPESMKALQHLCVTECRELTGNWLPASSVAQLQVLNINRTSSVHLPTGMTSLQELKIYEFGLSLPPDSARVVRKIHVGGDIHVGGGSVQLPEGMEALEEVYAADRYSIAADWLPTSSRACVRILSLKKVHVRCVPADLPVLETLVVSGCSSLAADWLRKSAGTWSRWTSQDSRRLQPQPLEAITAHNCHRLALTGSRGPGPRLQAEAWGSQITAMA